MNKTTIDFLHAYVDEFICGKFEASVEIEARLGHIVLSLTDEKVTFNTKHPVVFTSLSKFMRFNSAVKEKDFKKFSEILKENKNLESTKEFTKVELSKPYRRITTYKDIEQTEITNIDTQLKRKLYTMDIFLPESPYDVRIQINIEKKVKESSFTGKNIFIRNRVRNTYSSANIQYDMTEIEGGEKGKMYEVEIEMKKEMNGRSFLERIFEVNK